VSGTADIIITVRGASSDDGLDLSGWLELETLTLDRWGSWDVEAVCGCVAMGCSWKRCAEHGHWTRLFIQARLPFDVAHS
jgi:hypothetical protein